MLGVRHFVTFTLGLLFGIIYYLISIEGCFGGSIQVFQILENSQKNINMGHKLVHIMSGNVRDGNFGWIATAPDLTATTWRHNDQRVAARNAEIKRKAAHDKHQSDGLEKFRAALDKLHRDKKS